MENFDKRVLEMKETLEREHGREFSFDEAQDVLNTLNALAKIIVNISIEQCEWENKLTKIPQGFHIDRGATCMICGVTKQGNELWYDKYGLKCMICQDAIDQKVIPGVSIKNNNNWYSNIEMAIYFGIKATQIRKLTKGNHLKSRNILTKDGKVHFQIFLIKDNKGFLPPKSLLATTAVKEVIDGKEWICWKPWYKMVDPHKHLRKYAVVNFLDLKE